MNEQSMRALLLITVVTFLISPAPAGPPPGTVLASSLPSPATTPRLYLPTSLEHRPGQVWIVTTTDDESGPCTEDYCSLRQAITAANDNTGPDTINFDISIDDPRYDPATGQWTITLESSLPTLSNYDSLTIDAIPIGPGDCPNAYLVIDAASVPYGLEVTGANKTIKGVVIRNAQTHGLYVHGASAQGNQLMCSFVVSNTVDGVRIGGGAVGNTIGGSGTDQGNLIAFNGSDGVHITYPGTSNNVVVGNRIGTDTDGAAAWTNGGYGIRISNGALTNTVSSNLASGNASGGVLISGNATHSNIVQDNRIGTNFNGDAAIAGQEDGVVISGAPANTVGPDNLISGNERDGVRIEGGYAKNNVVEGNYIGTNADGDDRISNKRLGVMLQSESSSSIIGGDTIADGNIISGNGYDGDYPLYGGVAILNSSSNVLRNNLIGTTMDGTGALPNGGHGVRLDDSAQNNTIGQGILPEYANTIAWNEGDGIYVHGGSTFYNAVGRNSIHDNDDLGINNEAGGNVELSPPFISKYAASPAGWVDLEATACGGCTVLVYSDDDGEGRYYEGNGSAHPTSGFFYWSGVPKGSAFTLVATDANGNTSEFSGAPVRLSLSVDDALPHVVVNKVAGDADPPAGSTTVEFVATIVGSDPTLTGTLDVELLVLGDVLGPPTRVFYRDQISDYDGTPVTGWFSPSPGRYRVTGITLNHDQNSMALRWQRRVVFRFAVPDDVTPSPLLLTLGYLSAPNRPVGEGIDWAVLRLLRRVDEIIITNRARLYKDYDNSQVSRFLQNLYAFAQGPPSNWSPVSAVYYVDGYDPSLAHWDNTAVSYTSESAANTTTMKVDSLIEDWVEDSTTLTSTICLLSKPCYSVPRDNPQYLVIAGDDNVIPFYRKSDPTGSEGKHPGGGNAVLSALRKNNYFFTDDVYADLSTVHDGLAWNRGGVELAVGRLIGAQARDMSALLQASYYGPSGANTARAIVGSACGVDAQDIANRFVGRGYDVRNDTETPDTVDSNGWQESTLLGLMGKDYQILHHANHANEDEWCTPPCGCGGALTVSKILGTSAIRERMGGNFPIFSSNGCRAGLSSAMPGYYTVVNALAREEASAIVASTGINIGSLDFGTVKGSEHFMRAFWQQATQHPSTNSTKLGPALRWTKRTWCHQLSNSPVEKTRSEFVLYGVPWVAAPYRVGTTSDSLPVIASLQATGGSAVSSPRTIAAQTYVFTATFDGSGYSVSQVEGFDLVEVEGMSLSHEDGMPLVPLAEVELQLPADGVVLDVEAIATAPIDLGTLNIPAERLGVPIPGGDPGGLEEVPPEMGIYPPQPVISHTVAMDGYRLVHVQASPLIYNAATDQATLYQYLTLRMTYQLSSTVALLSLAADPTDLAPGEGFSVTAVVANPSDQPVTLAGTLLLKDNLGEVVDLWGINPFEVPPGGEQHQVQLGWTAPMAEGAYSLFLELWNEQGQQATGRQMLSVSGGRITNLAVPETIQPGEEAIFEVAFANRRGETFNGQATLFIYTAEGVLVTTLDAAISVGAGSEGTAELVWSTEGVPLGLYSAVVEVKDSEENIPYGAIPKSFSLQHEIFLPLIARGYP